MNLFTKYLLYLLTIQFVSIESGAYRILGVFAINARSHNNMFEGVTKALAKAGHQVDVVTHFEMKNPPKNYRTIINLSGTRKQLVNSWTMGEVNSLRNLDMISPEILEEFGNSLCELLALEKMQKLIKNPPKDPPYDLVLTEALLTNCYYGLGYAFKVPVIGISTMLEFSWTREYIGNSMSLAFSQRLDSDQADVLTFWDRLENVVIHHYQRYKFYYYIEKAQTDLMRKYINADIPDLRELEKNTALLFVNSYHNIFGVRPKTPSLVEIAGIHIEQNEAKFTPELETWMDESKDGVILFTLGSMVIIESLPEDTMLAIYASFEKIAPIRVLMKVIDNEKLPHGLPSNVKTLPWIPQVPVLSHNNTRLFITHGGLMSTLEAYYHGIPMIGYPLFGDQVLNMNMYVKRNVALKSDHREIEEKSLDEALSTVLNDSKYWESSKYESRIFRDRPMNASQTVVFWVEYIVRNGATVLRSPALDLHWWQNELLDVYFFLLTCFIMLTCITVLVFKFLLRIFPKMCLIMCSNNSKIPGK